MIQQELNKYIGKNFTSLRQKILSDFKQGKSGRQIARELSINDKKFDRLIKKLKIKNPCLKNRQKAIEERIRLRRQERSICEIARLQKVTDQAVFMTLQRYAPELLENPISISKDAEGFLRQRSKKLAQVITAKDLPELLEFRKQGYSVGALVTYPQRPVQKKLWYLSLGRKAERQIGGRISRQFLLSFYTEEEISEKEQKRTPYLSLNIFLDELLQERLEE